jgi:hypothetical protein
MAEGTDGRSGIEAHQVPHWVKAFGIAALVLTLLVLLVVASGGGGPHGPGRHVPSGGHGGGMHAGLLALLGVLATAALALNWAWVAPAGGARSRRAPIGWPAATMPAALRKLALVAHVVASVGFLGAVASFLALALVGLAGEDAEIARAAYRAMAAIAWAVIVPLCFAALLTGLIQALGTAWGLVQHYWVVVKLLLTLVTTVVLLLQTAAIDAVAAAAADATWSSIDLRAARISLASHAAGGLLVLLLATILSVYKPRGLTRAGWRRQQERARSLKP